MRNMIFKTLFASILGSFLVAPLALADRQGGGTLKVAMAIDIPDFVMALPAVDQPMEWVKFKGNAGDKIVIEYAWANELQRGASEVLMSKQDASGFERSFIGSIADSKKLSSWVVVPKN